jgi:hypothetical protein
LKWGAEYEPFDLSGWIPDFICRNQDNLLVEIKPSIQAPEAMLRIADLDVGMDVVLLCERLWDRAEYGDLQIGWIYSAEDKRWFSYTVSSGSEMDRFREAFRVAGNLVQWNPPEKRPYQVQIPDHRSVDMEDLLKWADEQFSGLLIDFAMHIDDHAMTRPGSVESFGDALRLMLNTCAVWMVEGVVHPEDLFVQIMPSGTCVLVGER